MRCCGSCRYLPGHKNCHKQTTKVKNIALYIYFKISISNNTIFFIILNCMSEGVLNIICIHDYELGSNKFKYLFGFNMISPKMPRSLFMAAK